MYLERFCREGERRFRSVARLVFLGNVLHQPAQVELDTFPLAALLASLSDLSNGVETPRSRLGGVTRLEQFHRLVTLICSVPLQQGSQRPQRRCLRRVVLSHFAAAPLSNLPSTDQRTDPSGAVPLPLATAIVASASEPAGMPASDLLGGDARGLRNRTRQRRLGLLLPPDKTRPPMLGEPALRPASGG